MYIVGGMSVGSWLAVIQEGCKANVNAYTHVPWEDKGMQLAIGILLCRSTCVHVSTQGSGHTSASVNRSPIVVNSSRRLEER